MFINNNFEQELIEGMRKSLITNQLENKYSLDKISKAANYLNIAAEILDDTGMYSEAEVVTRVLEKIAQINSSDNNYSHDEWEDGEDSEDFYRSELADKFNKDRQKQKIEQAQNLKENYFHIFSKVAKKLNISVDEAINYYLNSESREDSDLKDFQSLLLTVDFEKKYQKGNPDTNPF